MTPEAKARQAEYQRRYREKNKDRYLEYQREYQKKWRRENPEKVKQYQENYWNNVTPD